MSKLLCIRFKAEEINMCRINVLQDQDQESVLKGTCGQTRNKCEHKHKH